MQVDESLPCAKSCCGNSSIQTPYALPPKHSLHCPESGHAVQLHHQTILPYNFALASALSLPGALSMSLMLFMLMHVSRRGRSVGFKGGSGTENKSFCRNWQFYPLSWVRQGLHPCFDCVDWEHECVLKRAGHCSSKHVLQTQAISMVFDSGYTS